MALVLFPLLVSIPQGTIKSTCSMPSCSAATVSIPQGTIKRNLWLDVYIIKHRFQFHKVRLKEGDVQSYIETPVVSIPQGTIKSVIASWIILFQTRFNSTRYD